MNQSDIELNAPEYVTVKDEDVKKEYVHQEDVGDNSKNDQSGPSASSYSKCGEIFTENNFDFRLICLFCRRIYENLLDFGEHLREAHETLVVKQYDEVWCNEDETRAECSNEPGKVILELYTDKKSGSIDIEGLYCKKCSEHFRSRYARKRHKCETTVGKLYSSLNDDPGQEGAACLEEIEEYVAKKSEIVGDDSMKYSCKVCFKTYSKEQNIINHKCCAKSENDDMMEEPAELDWMENALEDFDSDDEPLVRKKSMSKKKASKQKYNVGKTMTNPDLYCEICNRQFKYKNIFKKHGMQHIVAPIALQKDPEYLKCRFCSLKLTNHAEWYIHEAEHTELTPYRCAHCPKTFKSRLEVDMHTNSHTGNKPYKCEKCGASFAHSNNLATHIKRVHLRLTPFSCEVCDKKFLRNVELRIHMRQHTGERPYQCEECGRSFMIAVQLNEHLKKHSNVRDVKCPECPMAFFTKKMLRKHMVKHSSERPHVCAICGRTFSRKKALDVHKKIHQEFKEYVCTICGKAFAQPAGLYSHKKSHMHAPPGAL